MPEYMVVYATGTVDFVEADSYEDAVREGEQLALREGYMGEAAVVREAWLADQVEFTGNQHGLFVRKV